MEKIYKAFGQKWHDENADMYFEEYKTFRIMASNSLTGLDTVYFCSHNNLYKFAFKLRAKEMLKEHL